MKFLFLKLLVVILFLSFKTTAQQQLYVPLNIQNAYNKESRSIDGKPGAKYWQNTADYDMQITFAPDTLMIFGKEDILYTNNSPDTLTYILFKLYPNLFKKGAPRIGEIDPQDLTNGVTIEKFAINGEEQEPDSIFVDATNMMVKIKELLPNQKMKFSIKWSYKLNETSHNRTGEIEKGASFVAYFFPRIAVYDDIDGWNDFQYNGLQEFYNDFCNFNVAISVPKNFIVWATGNLTNPEEVLTEKYVKKLRQAERNNEIIDIIDTSDLSMGDITVDNLVNTWKFHAENIVDFVFATSNHHVWKSTSLEVDPKTGRRTRIDAVFNPEHKDYKEVIYFALKTVEMMSYKFPAWPFPYPHMTVFDGLDEMEYPMMANDVPVNTRAGTAELTAHEIFHTMFPFYMGINETKYAFMDEGWATLAEWIIPRMIDSTFEENQFGLEAYNKEGGSEMDLPITTLSTSQSGSNFSSGSYFLNSYVKPALGYLYVKDMLGDSLFTKALHYYIEQWNGKHPTPNDFFNSFNKGANENLNWFWQKWFFDIGYPDLGIIDVIKNPGGYKVSLISEGNKPTPVDLTFTFEDGSEKKIHRSIEIWRNGNRSATIDLKSNKKLSKVVLGSTYNADINPDNNVFRMRK